eukprot:SAG31_NODE_29478_length_394_cov_1.464407_1_plen_38_part_10
MALCFLGSSPAVAAPNPAATIKCKPLIVRLHHGLHGWQ